LVVVVFVYGRRADRVGIGFSYGGREQSLEARAKMELGQLKAEGKEVVEKGKEMVERVKEKVVR